MKILGIDPGSRLTGYGIIETLPRGYCYVASGCLKVESEHFPTRLKNIFEGIIKLMEIYAPQAMAIEQVFMSKNADSALKLGHARGAAICAVQTKNIPVFEYATRQVKQAIVGKGSADKLQVQQMVKLLLEVHGNMQIDASDALGIAICHAHHAQTAQRIQKEAL